MHATTERKDGHDAQVKPRRRRWPFVTAVIVVGLLALVAVLPRLASFGPIRDLFLRAALPGVEGSIHVGTARLGWFSPIHLEDVEIRSPEGEPVVAMARLEGTQSLWRMIFGRDLGEFRVERPRVSIVLDHNGSNLTRVFAGRRPGEKKIRRPPDVALAVRLIDGSVSVRGADSSKAWTAEPINLAFRILPSRANADRQPHLEIEPGVVCASTQFTPEVCHDLLKYVAPVLADVTEAEGRFSVEVDRWDLPLADPGRGEGAGRLTIHELRVGPGPVVRELATFLKESPRLVTVEDEPVTFRMTEGRVYHDRFTFHLKRLAIRTSGSVGVADGSLAMVAEVTASEHPDPAARPLLAALADQTLRISIGGTLKRPKIDAKSLLESLPAMGADVLDNLRKNKKEKAAPSDRQSEGLDIDQLLKPILERRQQRLEKQRDEKKPSPAQPADEPKRPLRGLIRGIIDEAIDNTDEKTSRKEL
ncbi:MAG TPA: hypothetical protein VJL29_06775 [Thermoguttaceae bacterium]|nr:hypothetical protein [Thermoguttaceae bacterium]